MVWRVVFVFCMVSLLGTASFQLSISWPHTGMNHTRNDRSAEGKFEGRRPFYHPYVKQLYEKITYRNGSIIKGNIGDDPVTIWSFLDLGEQLATQAVCMRL